MPHQSSRLFGKVKVMRDGEKRKATGLHKSRGRKKGRRERRKGLLCCLLGTVPQTNWAKKGEGKKEKMGKASKSTTILVGRERQRERERINKWGTLGRKEEEEKLSPIGNIVRRCLLVP